MPVGESGGAQNNAPSLLCYNNNKNVFLILNVLLSQPFRSNIFKNMLFAFCFFFRNNGIVLDSFVRSCERTIVLQERRPALDTTPLIDISIG